jgi:predicted nucleic acid-binding protein
VIRLYLDLCCFNRPFDDQGQARVRLETDAKLELQAHVSTGHVELIWSYVLDYENARNPFEDRRESIARWRSMAVHRVQETEATRLLARQLANAGIKPYDALHAACAMAGAATLFVSTDDVLLKRLKASSSLKAALPAEALAIVENWYED